MKKSTRSNSRTSIELFDCLNYSKIIPTLSKTDTIQKWNVYKPHMNTGIYKL